MMLRSFLSPVTKRHVERQIINTHPLHLFRIIQDVDQYSSFLPLCSYSKIVRHITAPQWASDRRCFEATLTVGRPPFFQETYTSAVTVIPDRLLVETVSISSKRFDSLKSRWQLSTVFDQGGVVDYSNCAVSFEVELTVSDPIIIATLDKVLEQVAGRQVDAFAARCRQIPIATDLMASMGKQ